MTSEPRRVFDSNVIVSAALLPGHHRGRRSLPHARGRLLVSEATVRELDEVLRRPKFDKYVPEEVRLLFLAALVRGAELVEVRERVTACRGRRTISSSKLQ